MYIGDDTECFELAAALSLQCNFLMMDREIKKAVVFLDPHEFRSTWLGNKSVYRTRMALADDAELIVLAPGVHEFGEDAAIDALIRKYGYCGTPATLAAVKEDAAACGEPECRGAPDSWVERRPVHDPVLSRAPDAGGD